MQSQLTYSRKCLALAAALIACFAAGTARADAGDQVITLTVPITLSKLDPSIKTWGAQCFVVDNTNGQQTPSGGPMGESPQYPVQNAGANGQAMVSITVPQAMVMQLKGYVCRALGSQGQGIFGFDSTTILYYAKPGPGSTESAFGSLVKPEFNRK